MNSRIKELFSDFIPVRSSPSGEGYYSLADSLQIINAAVAADIAPASVEAFERSGNSVRVIGILELSRDLGSEWRWPWEEKVLAISNRIRRFIEAFQSETGEILFSIEVYGRDGTSTVL